VYLCIAGVMSIQNLYRNVEPSSIGKKLIRSLTRIKKLNLTEQIDLCCLMQTLWFIEYAYNVVFLAVFKLCDKT